MTLTLKQRVQTLLSGEVNQSGPSDRFIDDDAPQNIRRTKHGQFTVWKHRRQRPSRPKGRHRVFKTSTISPTNPSQFAAERVNARESQSYSVERVEFSDLEQRALSCPLAMSAIRLYSATIASLLKPSIIRASSQSDYDLITNVLMRQKTFRDVPLMGTRHLLTGGRAFAFPRYDGNKIVGYSMGDPRLIDFIKTDGWNVTTTDGITPKGFEYPDWVIFAEDNKVPKRQFINDKDIFHMAFNQWHYTEWGWGPVEILYDTLESKINLEESRLERSKREGFGAPIVQYGNERQLPSQMMKAEADFLVDELLDPMTVGLSYPFTMKIDALEALLKYSDTSEQTLATEKYLDNMVASVFMIPLSVLTMSDIGGNNRDVEELNTFYEWSVTELAQSLRLDELMTLWLRSQTGNDKAWAVVEWGNFLPGTIKETSMRLFRMGKLDMIPNNPETRRWIAQVIGADAETVKSIVKGETDKVAAPENQPFVPPNQPR